MSTIFFFALFVTVETFDALGISDLYQVNVVDLLKHFVMAHVFIRLVGCVLKRCSVHFDLLC